MVINERRILQRLINYMYIHIYVKLNIYIHKHIYT